MQGIQCGDICGFCGTLVDVKSKFDHSVDAVKYATVDFGAVELRAFTESVLAEYGAMPPTRRPFMSKEEFLNFGGPEVQSLYDAFKAELFGKIVVRDIDKEGKPR